MRWIIALLLTVQLGAAAIRLENNHVIVEIIPETGRITAWQLKGGRNVIWNNRSDDLVVLSVPGWKNHGGDKVWLVPQDQRPQVFGNKAPDPVIDGQAWTVTAQTAHSVALRSGRSLKLGCSVTRTISLDADAAALTIINTVERFAPSPYPVEIWSVTQAIRPEYGLLDLSDDLFPEQPRYWQMRKTPVSIQDNELKVELPKEGWTKVHSWGRAVSAVYEEVIFKQSFEVAKTGNYPDRSTAQFYVVENYVELELLSDLRPLKEGEAMTNRVRWELLPRTKDAWQQLLPGGGGRIMFCQMAPDDPEKLVATGDMGGVFQSPDGGKNWSLIDSRRMERAPWTLGASPFEFIPSHPGEVWCGSKTRGMLRSRDYGANWEPVAGPWDKLTLRDWWHWLGPEMIRFAADGQYGLAFWNSFGDNAEKKLFTTENGGGSWREIKLPERVKSLRAIRFLEDKALLIGVDGAWHLEKDRITELPTEWTGNVFATAVSGKGIYAGMMREDKSRILVRLDDRGRATLMDFDKGPVNSVAAPFDDDRTIYVGTRGTPGNPATVWKSTDSGKTWAAILTRKAKQSGTNISPDRWTTGRWGWNTPPASMVVDRSNPELVTFTDSTMCGYSRNGGKHWEIISTLPTHGEWIPGGGVPMITGWNYYIHGRSHYVATTDFANWRSLDGGRGWYFAPPENAIWHNNIYACAFDPADPNRMWAAISLKHDLPYWHHLITQGREPNLWRGGVLTSSDGGATWQMPDLKTYGVPDLPVTDILRTSDGVFLAAVLGAGVYRSEDGKNWCPFIGGLPEKANTLRIVQSPGGGIYTVVTAQWNPNTQCTTGGGIYRLNGDRWEKLPLPDGIVFPVSLTFGEDGKSMYIGCFQLWRERRRTGSGDFAEPGLWRADADGGHAVKLLHKLPVYEARPRPGKPDELYCGTIGEGLFRSIDDGRTWQPVPGCPAGNIHSITFDPADSSIVYLTTFGQGAWRGKL